MSCWQCFIGDLPSQVQGGGVIGFFFCSGVVVLKQGSCRKDGIILTQWITVDKLDATVPVLRSLVAKNQDSEFKECCGRIGLSSDELCVPVERCCSHSICSPLSHLLWVTKGFLDQVIMWNAIIFHRRACNKSSYRRFAKVLSI